MEGWLSNIPIITPILFFLSVIVGLISHWWLGILMFFIAITAGVLAKMLWGRSVSYYLAFLYHKMANRAADYKRENDLERFEAAESYYKDLQQLMLLYENSGLRPPKPKQLKDIPYGDLYYWLTYESGDA